MFSLIFDDTVRFVEKIKQDNFTSYHHEVIGSLQYENKKLFFKDKAWSSILLGAGEEKAVYCICDHNNKVFALEVIDEKHYLNGRLINGEYFFQKRIGNLVDVKFNPHSLIGLTFTGLVKVREFISEFNSYAERYKDVHDRNVIFEIKGKSGKGARIFYIDSNKKLKTGKILLRAIDVR